MVLLAKRDTRRERLGASSAVLSFFEALLPTGFICLQDGTAVAQNCFSFATACWQRRTDMESPARLMQVCARRMWRSSKVREPGRLGMRSPDELRDSAIPGKKW